MSASKDGKENYGFFEGQIKFAEGCAKTLKETAGKTYYKDAVSCFIPNNSYFEPVIDYQQALINNTFMYGSVNSTAYADSLKAVSQDDKKQK